jgi:hypothetical protein
MLSVRRPGGVAFLADDPPVLGWHRLGQLIQRAMARIQADPGPGDDTPAFAREQLAEAWE